MLGYVWHGVLMFVLIVSIVFRIVFRNTLTEEIEELGKDTEWLQPIRNEHNTVHYNWAFDAFLLFLIFIVFIVGW